MMKFRENKNILNIIRLLIIGFVLISLTYYASLATTKLTNKSLSLLMADAVTGSSLEKWANIKTIYLMHGNKNEMNKLNIAKIGDIENARDIIRGAVSLNDENESRKMLDFLISHGLDINSRNGIKDDAGVLFDLINDINPVGVKLLTELKIDKNARVSTSYFKELTALEFAEKMQEILLEKNFNEIISLLEKDA